MDTVVSGLPIGPILQGQTVQEEVRLILPSSGLLCSVRWFYTGVSGLPISPILQGQAVQEEVKLILPFSGLLCGVSWFDTEVSELLICPIFSLDSLIPKDVNQQVVPKRQYQTTLRRVNNPEYGRIQA